MRLVANFRFHTLTHFYEIFKNYYKLKINACWIFKLYEWKQSRIFHSFILRPCMFSTNILGTASELASWVPVFLLENKMGLMIVSEVSNITSIMNMKHSYQSGQHKGTQQMFYTIVAKSVSNSPFLHLFISVLPALLLKWMQKKLFCTVKYYRCE